MSGAVVGFTKCVARPEQSGATTPCATSATSGACDKYFAEPTLCPYLSSSACKE
ncbi:hypothetical protein [Paraburkholderia tuberum]|uniref:Uncharacterized protein n=1 Tax=Paraburkholderia tuberum TaxID=157910 RepID=A0A1H1KCB8_9BURK|nr:hypothetical protein [Paraburkholderia tuberum]SDR59971.1 hypothetical protein SAMN05445850_7047 [Paraburkholderia tuberum]